MFAFAYCVFALLENVNESNVDGLAIIPVVKNADVVYRMCAQCDQCNGLACSKYDIRSHKFVNERVWCVHVQLKWKNP